MHSILILIAIILLTPDAHAGYRDLFEKEFMQSPWAGLSLAGSACIECHTSEMMEDDLIDIPGQWQQSWHYRKDISCHHCHGGDPEDESMAMSHQRGFSGSPSYNAIPVLCGKCHIGIMKNYFNSGHGKALTASPPGPNCVTCHGSHNIQRANIEIINEELCGSCHSYDRAKEIKQALFVVENRLDGIRNKLDFLQSKGIMAQRLEMALFRAHSEYRTLFHTIDLGLVKGKTSSFVERFDRIEGGLQKYFNELGFRRNFSSFIFLLFTVMGIVLFILAKTCNSKKNGVEMPQAGDADAKQK